MNKSKSTIIIPCSDAKLSTSDTEAYEQYTGSLMSIVRQFDKKVVLDNFNILFISAKYGLIDSSDVIANYNQRMGNTHEEQFQYAATHKRKANRLLKQVASKESYCYVVLSKDYLNAFELMSLSALKEFSTVYYSLKARGIGDHRSRLKKIITSHVNPTDFSPTLFRSGCCNASEFIAYRAAGQAIGTSLHYLSNQAFLQYTIDTVKSGTPCFVDNGIISAFNKGVDLDESHVFERYITIVKSVGKYARLLSVVVPDSPQDESKALQTIITYKKEIKWLAARCNVIIPFHIPVKYTVANQAELISKILGKSPVTVGIPCRKVKGANWRMEVADIETLLEFKVDGQYWVKRIHYFALSEKTKGTVYKERLALAKMYSLECQLDACRTPALFGREASSNRLGSKTSRQVTSELILFNTLKSVDFKNYDGESEIDRGELFDEINSLSPQAKAHLWNECKLGGDIDLDDTDDGIEEVFENLTNAYFHYFIEKAKCVLVYLFKHQEHEPSHHQKRTESIVRIFNKNQPVPVQYVMSF